MSSDCTAEPPKSKVPSGKCLFGTEDQNLPGELMTTASALEIATFIFLRLAVTLAVLSVD